MNWKQIAITGILAGVVTATGCSTNNTTDSNQGTRNAQRVTESTNRRADYSNGGVINNVTRGINRAANSISNDIKGSGINNNNRTNTTRSSNPLNVGNPQGRIGNTYKYPGHKSNVQGVNRNNEYSVNGSEVTGVGVDRTVACVNRATAFDNGVTVTNNQVTQAEQNMVNGRTVRSTAPQAAIAPTQTAARTTTNNGPRAEVKRIDTKRKETPTRTAAPKANEKHEQKPAELKPITRSVPLNPIGKTHRVGQNRTMARKFVNSETTPRVTRSRNASTRITGNNATVNTRGNNNPGVNAGVVRGLNNSNINNGVVHNANNGNVTRNTTVRKARQKHNVNGVNHGVVRGLNTHSTMNNGVTRNANNGVVRNTTNSNKTVRKARQNHNANGVVRGMNGTNTVNNSVVRGMNSGNYMDTTGISDQTVAVVNNEDTFVSNNDVAFFRKKTDEQAPTTPPAITVPQAVPGPTSSTADYDDDYSYDDNYEDTTESEATNVQPAPVAPAPTTKPATPAKPARLSPNNATSQRAMK